MSDGAGLFKEMARMLGARGGKKRAKNLTPEKRKAIASRAGKASAGKKNGRRKKKKKKEEEEKPKNFKPQLACLVTATIAAKENN